MLKKMGFSLIELIIAMAIGAAVLLIATSSVLTLAHSLNALHQRMVLESELRLLTQTLSLQLTRAGYIAYSNLDENSSASQLSSNQLPPALEVDRHPSHAPNSCVLFAYDKNHDGEISASSPSELLGFRLHDKALEYRVAGKSCSQSGWHDLSDKKKIEVSAFSVTPLSHYINERVIKIFIAVQATHRHELNTSATLVVRINNAY